LAAIPLRGIRFYRPFYVIQRKNRQLSPLCEAFLVYLRMESREISAP